MDDIRQLAIIGSTASGKTSLAVKVAKHLNAHILSLDSLSIYKEIDIVSAKPTLEEREGIRHFGLDMIYPDEAFDVTTFIALYKEVVKICQEEEKALVIVGGTSFYLKMLLEGVSDLPTISADTKKEASALLHDLPKAHQMLYKLDPESMSSIENNDRYRIEKTLHIYLESTQVPSVYFKEHPPLPTITASLPVYQREWERALLRERIALRTQVMSKEGLIDEICYLEKTYGRKPNCMKAIGIKETLAYLDGIYSKNEMIEKISTNIARLAKRQKTFNNSQFTDVIKGSVEVLEKELLR
jgi:tRNA dimethylallyltransferase